MTDPQALAQRATARPWEAFLRDTDAPFLSNRYRTRSLVGYGKGYEARGLFVATDINGHDREDAAFIVYAVNHIEQAEAERDEALRLLRDLGDEDGGMDPDDWDRRVQALLRRHDAQPGERP